MTGSCEDKGMVRGKTECHEQTTCKEDDIHSSPVQYMPHIVCFFSFVPFQVPLHGLCECSPLVTCSLPFRVLIRCTSCRLWKQFRTV